MFVVKFVRKDGHLDEEYYYQREEDANIHFDLFKADDSGLYSQIVIEKLSEPQSSILATMHFSSKKID